MTFALILAPLLLTAEPQPVELTDHTADVFSLAFSPDGGKLFVGCATDAAHVYAEPYGKPAAVLKDTGLLLASAFSPDGKHVATGGEDGRPGCGTPRPAAGSGNSPTRRRWSASGSPPAAGCSPPTAATPPGSGT